MKIVYGTISPLVRAGSIYTKDELAKKNLKPTTKVSKNSTNIVIHQKWTKDPSTLLTSNSLEELLAIDDKTVGIVQGRCEPPLITIDPDNKEKADLLMSIVEQLPPEQKPLMISKGVGKAGYNFTYHDTPENKLMTDYVYDIHKGGLGDDIDVLSGSGRMMFMANKGNETKELIHLADDTETIRPVPTVLQLAVMALFKDARPQHLDIRKESGSYLPEHTSQVSTLGFMFKDFNPADSTTSVLLGNFIAKRAKADLKENFKAPEDEQYPYQPKYYTTKPHDLLLRLSGSLKNDIGISPTQHRTIIHTINNMLPHSKNLDHLEAEILRRDIEELEDLYPYRKDWESITASVYTNDKQVIDIYRVTLASSKNPHMLHNTETGEVRLFSSVALMLEELSGEVSKPIKALKMIQSKAQLVELLERPDKPFGLLPPEPNSVSKRYSFNIYRRTILQNLLYDTKETMRLLKHTYKYPSITIAAIESQMGKEKTHNLFLPFLRRKLFTRQPTPLIFALMGVPHSFKTGLVEGILKPLFSSNRFLKTNGEILTEKHNDFMVNTDIILIDEIHHLKGTPLLKPVVQKLNALGSENLEGIRAMYSSVVKGGDIPQEITPFVTMNSPTRITSESAGERRVVVGYSLVPLREALSMSDPDIKRAIENEREDFAIYLSLHVNNISEVDYIHNKRWKEIDDHYYRYMDESISKLDKLVMYIGGTYDTPKLDKLQELIYPRQLKDSIIKLKRASHGSQYRLRLWNAEGSFNVEIPGIIDHIDEINYNSVPSKLAHNANVLKPSAVSTKIRQRKQDLVISEEVLIEYGMLPEETVEAISDSATIEL